MRLRGRWALALVVLATPAAAQDHVMQRLESSPRHHEWVEVKVGERTIHSFLAFPEVSTKATAVVVIHDHLLHPNPLAPSLFAGARLVQLWHGISIKEVGLRNLGVLAPPAGVYEGFAYIGQTALANIVAVIT